jgi:anti-anti-sigma factor
MPGGRRRSARGRDRRRPRLSAVPARRHGRADDALPGRRPAATVLTLYGGAGLPVVTVRGEIDLATVSLLDRHLAAVVTSRTPDVVVDLGRVRFMDATGLGALIRADRRARRHGGRVRLTRVPPGVSRLLSAVGLAGHFPIEPGA